MTLLLLAGPACRHAHAQAGDGIHRCVDRSGGQIFTDRSCADLEATPALPSVAPVPTTAAAMGQPVMPLCVIDLPALKQQVVEAFAGNQPNRLAGLMLWDGYSADAVVEQIRALSELMRHPLLDITDYGGGRTAHAGAPVDLYDASQPLAHLLAAGENHAAATAQAPAGISVLTQAEDGSGSSRSTAFALEQQSGCLWLRPTN
ncbi:DUF4124 domain-containing protein [Dyella sp.]|uniref:DUF4124 domain-containing protein n=1 Tax=Dyella sp. TaxID=1869338 RepID=UPI002D767B2E|nr:DUF4124 domain-containing protein [Dyella sp.]HET6431625.1 DUF4124 domain-containing protein [Dyella sp.]